MVSEQIEFKMIKKQHIYLHIQLFSGTGKKSNITVSLAARLAAKKSTIFLDKKTVLQWSDGLHKHLNMMLLSAKRLI